MRSLLAAITALFIASCAGADTGSQTTPVASSARPVASPTAPSALAAVQRPGDIALIDLDGTVVASVPLPTPQANGFVGVVGIGAGGDRAAYFDTRTGALMALHRDGRVEQLGVISPASFAHLMLSPDGLRWAWADETVDQGGVIHTQLHISDQAGDRVIQRLDSQDSALRPISWDQGGLIVESEPIGRMTAPIFDLATGPTELVDPTSGAIKRLVLPPGCTFSARALDGTIACQSQTSSGSSLTFIEPDGRARSVQLPAGGFNAAGHVSFRPGPSTTQALVGGVQLGQHDQFATALINVDGGQPQAFGPAGLAPASGEQWVWLDGGLVIGMGWLTDPATDSGVWLYSAAGSARHISPGRAFGVL